MKNIRFLTLFLLAASLAAGRALAQSNRIPGPTEYGSLSRFITDRNIFDPNRQAHSYGGTTHISRPVKHTYSSAPAFSFCGTMSYEKGLFAFFSGNQEDYKQILSLNQTIAGYHVTAITLTNVVLISADNKETNNLALGDSLHQDGGHWVLYTAAEAPELPGHNASATDSSASPTAGGSASSTTSAPGPSPDSAPNDIIKRLMEQRKKEQQ